MYIDLFSHLFKKYSLNVFSVPRLAAGSDNWNMLLCTMEKGSKTQDPGEQVCCGVLYRTNQKDLAPSALSIWLQCTSSLLWFAVTQKSERLMLWGSSHNVCSCSLEI